MLISNNQLLCKVVVLGDPYVGKTCLLTRYTDDRYIQHYKSTIGCDFRVRSTNVEGKLVKLQIWDTAGQERFQSLSACYYKGTDCMLLTYDVSNKKSFENVNEWLKSIEVYPETKEIMKVLTGCKIDMEDKRQVSREKGMKKAKELGISFYETSAKTGDGVNELFEDIAKMLADTPVPTQKTSAQDTRMLKRKSSLFRDGCEC
eukprot:TRINITY_DN13352_c0_g1_i8.p1 TRINITY_DN13352_c0_g1~~TRINITY_DN13352_c0_g1_i8.p1  ORF type:complete len:203 (+),score=57.69 TRINITY_DN13352_c0_g1_i8:165-773(+)